MDGPVFKLQSVVKSVDESSDFEGPLTLILVLLSKNKIEIRDISISLILEQYLEYMSEMAEMDLDIASDFVAMASHLTYIKTKMLLSEDEEITELDQLISSLEELKRGDSYQQIKQVSNILMEMYKRGGGMMPGPPEYLPSVGEQAYEHTAEDLLDGLLQVIGRENAVIISRNPKQASYPRRTVYPISEKITAILDMLKQRGDMTAREMFLLGKSRTEIVAILIAVLELCRVGAILLTGKAGETSITYLGMGREPLAADLDEGWSH